MFFYFILFLCILWIPLKTDLTFKYIFNPIFMSDVSQKCAIFSSALEYIIGHFLAALKTTTF